ncbi:MAG: hypothetical protein JSR44_02735 [Spirochaetes bacterium]|nr:hypothetical protein [Spirochaetota bacterium]
MRFKWRHASVLAAIVLLTIISPIKVTTQAEIYFPAGVREFKTGRYTLTAAVPKPNRIHEEIEAELYIPPRISGPVPLVVFIHGNARNKNYYKSAANFLITVAPAKRAMILSVQNWWPLSGDHLDAVEDTRRATNIFVNRLAAGGIVTPGQVYLSGFSAGGIAVISTFFQSVDLLRDAEFRKKYTEANQAKFEAEKKSADEYYYYVDNPGKEAAFYPYAGVISIKGNFYAKYFKFDSLLTGEERRKITAPFIYDKKVVLTVGGDREAKDVVLEVPICRDFIRYVWGAKYDYHEYGDDVHDITKSDQDHLWAMLP